MLICFFEAAAKSERDRVFYPLGISYVAGYVKNVYPDINVKILRNLAEIESLNPDLVGITSVSSSVNSAIEIARSIKKQFNIPVILGGPHITCLPDALPSVFDAGVIGEGEITFLEIVKIILKNGRISVEDMVNIDGLVINTEKGIERTKLRKQIENLDTIPLPMREWNNINPFVQWIFSARGCPFRCSFCASPVIWKSYRAHSPENVVKEVDYLIERFNISFCIFMDDLFAVNIDRVKRIAFLVNEKPKRKLKYTVTLRAELATEEMCSSLKEMGAAFVHIGIESGSEKVLKVMKSSVTSLKTVQMALERCSSAGLHTIGSFIIGSPQEDENDLLETYNFIERNLKNGSLKGFSFSPLVPFPGTLIWNECIEKGKIDPGSIEWEKLDINLLEFNPDDYLLMSDKISHGRFKYYFEKFMCLFKTVMSPK